MKTYKDSNLERSGYSCSPVPAKKQGVPLNPTVSDNLHLLVFKFINNGGHPTTTTVDMKLRGIIDYCIEHGNELNGHQHMGKRKFLGIQFAIFKRLLDVVTNETKLIRQWYIEETVRLFSFCC